MPFTLTGAQVRELRLAVGVTQAELARHIGYSRKTICKWEHSPDKSIPRTHYQPVLDYLVARKDSAAAQLAQLGRLRAG